MLRITTNTTPAAAKKYYTTADYYSEGQSLVGTWHGKGAERLGLSGGVEKADWDALCDNINPVTREQLTVRRQQDRRIGYDFNFNCPKSLSLLYGLTQDERLVEAVQTSATETMQEMEREMKTRVRMKSRNEDRLSRNMIWGQYVHTTGRPVGGVPDPSLHMHCFVFNATYDETELRWKAGQFADVKRDAPYFEAVFHAKLARRMEELGLETVRTKDRWELAGISRELIERFSRRTGEIERKAKEKGITDPKLKAELGAKTRRHKEQKHSFRELQVIWKSWLTPEDSQRLLVLGHRIGSPALPEIPDVARHGVEQAAEHLFERSAVVPERRLLTEALKRGVGKATVSSIEAAYGSSGLITGERKGKRLVTTKGVLAEEQRMIDFARKGRGTCDKLGGDGEHEFKRKEFGRDQVAVILHVLNSRDRVIMVRGAAGVGKTFAMQESVEAIEANGHKVFTLAPSADASRGVLREEAKFADADTVAKLLTDERMQAEIRPGDVLWVDEAGLLGSKTLGEVFDLAERTDARVILQGDKRQHGSVERGSVLRLLEEEAGLVAAEIKEIRRQSGDYKRAVQALSEGRIEDGFKQLDDLGWIREIDGSERYKVLAADYVNAVTHGETALVVSPTHAEGRRCTRAIRSELKRLGRLGDEDRTFRTLASANLTLAQRSDPICFCPGDVLVFHQNANGFRRGQRVVVDDKIDAFPLNQAERFQVFETGEIKLAKGDVIRITKNGESVEGHRLNNGSRYRVDHFTPQGDIALDNGWTISKDWGYLAHGYVTTSHASQGKSVDRVFIGQSSESFPASSREQAYVSISRGKKGCVLYTDDKEVLLDAVRHSDERLSATEFDCHRQAVERSVTPERQRAAAADIGRAFRETDRDLVRQ